MEGLLDTHPNYLKEAPGEALPWSWSTISWDEWHLNYCAGVTQGRHEDPPCSRPHGISEASARPRRAKTPWHCSANQWQGKAPRKERRGREEPEVNSRR